MSLPRSSSSALPAVRLRWRFFRLLVIGLALAGCTGAPVGDRRVHTERSAYQTIVVSDSATRRCLRFGESALALDQSCQSFAQPDHLVFDYTRAMTAVLLLWDPPPQRILLIGVGGGSIAKALIAARPDADIDAVEIDEAVLKVAQRYFGLTPSTRLRLHAADGRAFVTAARARGATWDAVLLDAFDAKGIPPDLYSDEFLRNVRAVLTPSGVFLANTFASSKSYVKESATTARVFGGYYSVRLSTTGGNRLIVAAADDQQLPRPARLLDRVPVQAQALTRIGIDPAWVQRLSFAARD